MTTAPLRIWAANLLLVPEFFGIRPFLGVSWTLIIEAAWYGIFAASLMLFARRAADRLDIAVATLLVMLSISSLMLGVRLPLGRLLMIYAAVIGYQCFRFREGEIVRGHLLRSVAVFVGVATLVNVVEFGVFTHARLSLAQAIWPWLFGTAFFVGWVSYPPVRTARLLNEGLIPKLGTKSYSIYLLHPIAISFANANVPPGMQIVAALGLTLLLSWIGYQVVELPAIRVGRVAANLVAGHRSVRVSR